METMMKADLRPRYYGSHTTVVPAKEEIQKFVQECLGEIKDPDDIDIDKMAERAYYHFNKNWSPFADVPDVYYEVVEEIVL